MTGKAMSVTTSVSRIDASRPLSFSCVGNQFWHRIVGFGATLVAATGTTNDCSSNLGSTMGRWPDSKRSTLTTALLMFVLFPLLCLLAWWYVNH